VFFISYCLFIRKAYKLHMNTTCSSNLIALKCFFSVDSKIQVKEMLYLHVNVTFIFKIL